MKKRLVFLIGFFIVITLLPYVLAETYVFNTTEDFANGTYIDIDISNDNLKLGADATIFKYLWVANADESSVSKIDTVTNKEVARYWTGSRSGHNPSRTAVDRKGNVWVGNRNGNRAVVKIAGNIKNCIDKNNDGQIQTSYDDDKNGKITVNEMYDWGKDECVLLSVKHWSNSGDTGPRAVAVDLEGYVWVGIWGERKYYKLNPVTGDEVAIVNTDANAVKAVSTYSFEHQSYGAAIDSKGFLWSTSHRNKADDSVLKINTISNELVAAYKSSYNHYGIVVDNEDNLWLGNAEHSGVVKFDTVENKFTRFAYNKGGTKGVTVDRNGKIWLAGYDQGKAFRFNPVTEEWECEVRVGRNPVGVILDVDGYIWAVNRGSSNAMKIDSQNCNVVATVSTGKGPYTYSDATGMSLFYNILTGTWSKIFNIAQDSTAKISWVEENVLNNNLIVEKKGVGDADFVEISQVQEFNAEAGSLEVRITINRNADETSPVLESLSVDITPAIVINLTYANWTDAVTGGVITLVGDGDLVNLTARGTGLSDGTQINFTIYEAEPLGARDYVTKIITTLISNEAKATWTTQWIDDGIGQGDPEYYFIASLVSNPGINLQSGDLEVSSECVPLTCSELRASGTISEDDCINFNDGCGGVIDCTSCSHISSAAECFEGKCIVTGILYCKDYNQTDCGNYDPAVAIRTLQEEQGYGLNFCGSLDEHDCTIDCVCAWRLINNSYKCEGGWNATSCPEAEDLGECFPTGGSLEKDCDKAPNVGFRNISLTFNWTGSLSNKPAECQLKRSSLVKCISRVMLDFFDTFRLIIAVLIVIVFYLIVLRKRRNFRKQRRKK